MGNFSDMFSGIGGGLVGMAQNKADFERLQQLAGTPGLSDKDFEQVSYAGDLQPEMYGAPEAAAYQTYAEDPRTRDYQMQALSRLQQFGDQAANSAESLGRYNAVSDANAVAAQREAGIRNQMAMRGQGGTGMEFVLQQQAAQEAANRAQGGALNAAQQAALQRLMGTQAAMSGASNVRGMDSDVGFKNAGIINAFNMANTGQRNAVNMANTDMRNAASAHNLGTKQGLMAHNTGIRNQSLSRDDANRIANMDAQRQHFGMGRNITSGQADRAGQFAGGMGSFVDAVADMGTGGMG